MRRQADRPTGRPRGESGAPCVRVHSCPKMESVGQLEQQTADTKSEKSERLLFQRKARPIFSVAATSDFVPHLFVEHIFTIAVPGWSLS